MERIKGGGTTHTHTLKGNIQNDFASPKEARKRAPLITKNTLRNCLSEILFPIHPIHYCLYGAWNVIYPVIHIIWHEVLWLKHFILGIYSRFILKIFSCIKNTKGINVDIFDINEEYRVYYLIFGVCKKKWEQVSSRRNSPKPYGFALSLILWKCSLSLNTCILN